MNCFQTSLFLLLDSSYFCNRCTDLFVGAIKIISKGFATEAIAEEKLKKDGKLVFLKKIFS